MCIFALLSQGKARCACVCVCLSEWIQMVFGIQTWHGAPLMSSLLPAQVFFTVVYLCYGSTGTTDAESRHAALKRVRWNYSAPPFLFLLHLLLPSPSLAPTSQLSLGFLSFLLMALCYEFWAFAICILLMTVCVCANVRVFTIGSADCCLGRSYMCIEGMRNAFP